MNETIVCHVVESFSTGVYSWVLGVCENGRVHNPQNIIYSKREETPTEFKEDFLNTQLYYVSMVREISVVNDAASAIEIHKCLKKVRPNVIHSHSAKAGFIVRLLAPFLGSKRKIVYSPHGLSFERQDISALTKIFYIFLENFASFFSSTVLCCSKSESEIYKKYVPFAKCHYIENFCDTEKFASTYKKRLERLNQESGALHVITVGGIRTQKNPEAFAKIAGVLKECNIQFTWVGDGEEADVETLKSASVVVTGWLNAEAVQEKLSQADVYLQTSLWEGMPISVIEAMAAGLPCVVSNIPGNTDCVTHSENGYIYNSEEEAADYIKLFNDREYLIQCSSAARKETEQRFSKEKFIASLTDYYQSLIER